ncbi:MAG: TIGR04283 family arsenosugar biosynthesis glycosyltransferase [Pseudomonadota bacterium]
MPAPLSVVIPTLNAAEALPGTLRSLIEGLDAGLIRDLTLTDGGSTDDTRAIGLDAGAEVIECKRGRGLQVARGIAASRGEWLLILHADTELAPGWAAEVLAHIAAHPGRAGYFRLRFRATGLLPQIVAGWANLRARLFALPYGDQGLVISKAQLEAVGGYPELPLMEDVALARRLRRRLLPLATVASTSASRYEAEGWVIRGARNGVTLLRYFSGADPARLAKSYEASRESSSAN